MDELRKFGKNILINENEANILLKYNIDVTKCNSIDEVIRNTKELLNNKDLQEEMINNQKKYVKQDTCEKISELVIDEIRAGEEYEK